MFLEVGIVQIHAIWPKVGTLAVDIVLVLRVFNVSNQIVKVQARLPWSTTTTTKLIFT